MVRAPSGVRNTPSDAAIDEMCHGFARNYGGLISLRVLLGIAEAGVSTISMAFTRFVTDFG